MIGLKPKEIVEMFARASGGQTISTIKMEHCCSCGEEVNPDTLKKYLGHILCKCCVRKLIKQGTVK